MSTTTANITPSAPTQPFDEALDYISSYTKLTYIGKPGAVDSIDSKLPLVFYVHPFCGMRTPDVPYITEAVKVRELAFIKSLTKIPLTVVFVLGGDFYNAYISKIIADEIKRESYFALSVDDEGKSTYNSGNMAAGFNDTHLQVYSQVKGLVELSETVSQVYSTGSFLDRCHATNYHNLRYLFSRTIVPFGSVFARRDHTPVLKPEHRQGVVFGNMVNLWKYDWSIVDIPRSTYELSTLTLEEHLKSVNERK